MMYRVEILRSAAKELQRIHPDDRVRIIAALQNLANDPRPNGCKKLTNRPAWRIRIGAYRVIYEIHDRELLVLVVTAGKRNEIYRT
ncbi:MAG: type II toxin-antitoxin system RelE/ParE family toxin [Desulfomicrobium apsheronum]|nr:type II toxin-antitoxin system RelE/ParE family toxin [Desulfomicrobium apsheronum]